MWDRYVRWDGTYEEVVARGERGGLVRAERVEVVRLARERGVHVVNHGLGDRRDIYSMKTHTGNVSKRESMREARTAAGEHEEWAVRGTGWEKRSGGKGGHEARERHSRRASAGRRRVGSGSDAKHAHDVVSTLP